MMGVLRLRPPSWCVGRKEGATSGQPSSHTVVEAVSRFGASSHLTKSVLSTTKRVELDAHERCDTQKNQGSSIRDRLQTMLGRLHRRDEAPSGNMKARASIPVTLPHPERPPRTIRHCGARSQERAPNPLKAHDHRS